ncbi:MAG: M23 family metallopeptidase [Patescibacteria group bacterium]
MLIQALFYTRLFSIFISLSLPTFAYAGIFSFVSNLFTDTAQAQVATVATSQNISLLQATISSNPTLAKGGGDIVVVSDTALLSETGPSGSMADIDEAHSDQISIYVVRPGDTLSQIAKMFRVSVNTIVWANDVTPSSLKIGQQLIILPISGTQHTIKAGDTLKSIAAKYKADIEEIKQFNNLKDGEALAVGGTLIVPDGEVATVKKVTGTTPTSKPRGTGGPSLDGYYASPLGAYVKTQGIHGYNGVDLGDPVGTPIMAAASGEVIISKNSGWNGGYGEYVVISHPNGTQTLYAHMSSDIVAQGTHVNQGQVIGFVGNTGKSTGAHLHFEVRGAKNPF